MADPLFDWFCFNRTSKYVDIFNKAAEFKEAKQEVNKAAESEEFKQRVTCTVIPNPFLIN